MTWKAGGRHPVLRGDQERLPHGRGHRGLRPDARRGHGVPLQARRPDHLQGTAVAAQLEGYFADDHWLANARHANAMARRLADGLARLARCPARLADAGQRGVSDPASTRGHERPAPGRRRAIHPWTDASLAPGEAVGRGGEPDPPRGVVRHAGGARSTASLDDRGAPRRRGTRRSEPTEKRPGGAGALPVETRSERRVTRPASSRDWLDRLRGGAAAGSGSASASWPPGSRGRDRRGAGRSRGSRPSPGRRRRAGSGARRCAPRCPGRGRRPCRVLGGLLLAADESAFSFTSIDEIARR